MEVPSEIISEIVRYLPKLDLKATRQVSKSWSRASSRQLFDKIHISPRKEDIEAFWYITQHADLRFYPKHLEYDATYFSTHLTKSAYCKRLVDQFDNGRTPDRFHISPRKEDIEAFRYITQHAGLRFYPKHLEYDATYFSTHLTKSTYSKRLVDQFDNRRTFDDTYTLYDEHSETSDPQLQRFCKLCRRNKSWQMIEKKCKGLRLLSRGLPSMAKSS